MSRIFQCFIIDDESDSRNLIKKYADRVPYLKICGESGESVHALFKVQHEKPDIIFLDIEMPDMNGFEFLRTLNCKRPEIIIVTAYPQYAVEAFNHEVSDYLVKPMSFERFMKAVNKVCKPFLDTNDITPSNKPTMISKTPAEYQAIIPLTRSNESISDFLLVKQDKKLIQVEISSIIYLESLKDYVRLILHQKQIVSYGTLKSMLEILPGNRFLRISRSCIVRSAAISEIDGNQITLTNGKKVDIGITYREEVIGYLKQQIR